MSTKRLPAACRFETDEVIITKEGDQLTFASAR